MRDMLHQGGQGERRDKDRADAHEADAHEADAREGALIRALRATATRCGLDESTRHAMRARVLSRAAAAKAAKAAAPRSADVVSNGPRLASRRLAARFIAVVTASSMLGGSGGLAYAAQDAVPGERLYGVKRVTERAGSALALTPDARARMELVLVRRRQAEVDLLSERDPAVAAVYTEEAVAQAHRAARATAALSEPAKADLVGRLIAITARQRVRIAEIAVMLGADAGPGIREALSRAGEKARSQALEIMLQRDAAAPSPPPDERPPSGPDPADE